MIIKSESPKKLSKYMFELRERPDGKGVSLLAHVLHRGDFELFYFGTDGLLHPL